MYNTIFLEWLEIMVHRYLWRNLETNRPPDIKAILRVNMGDKCAGAIASACKDETAQMFNHLSPRAAEMLLNDAYVDDIVKSLTFFHKVSRTVGCV